MTSASGAIDNETATVGVAYTGQVTVTVTPSNATGITTTYALSGAAAAGLSVSASGAITGTPTTAGGFGVSVTVKDDSGTTKTPYLTITVGAAELSEAPAVMASHYQPVLPPKDAAEPKADKKAKK